jgi:hypothetical protein
VRCRKGSYAWSTADIRVLPAAGYDSSSSRQAYINGSSADKTQDGRLRPDGLHGRLALSQQTPLALPASFYQLFIISGGCCSTRAGVELACMLGRYRAGSRERLPVCEMEIGSGAAQIFRRCAIQARLYALLQARRHRQERVRVATCSAALILPVPASASPRGEPSNCPSYCWHEAPWTKASRPIYRAWLLVASCVAQLAGCSACRCYFLSSSSPSVVRPCHCYHIPTTIHSSRYLPYLHVW